MRDINTIKQEIRNAEQLVNKMNVEREHASRCLSNREMLSRQFQADVERLEQEKKDLETQKQNAWRNQNAEELRNTYQRLNQVEKNIREKWSHLDSVREQLNELKRDCNIYSSKAERVKKEIENLKQELKDAEQKQAWNEKSKIDFDKYDKGEPSTSGFKKSFGF